MEPLFYYQVTENAGIPRRIYYNEAEIADTVDIFPELHVFISPVALVPILNLGVGRLYMMVPD